ncbi:hypothetical protein ACH5Y9_06485 [Methylomonas sp. BW4-1]|uniref:hypothetical protein n=1 Tax=Methylomonas sp. BW4-1 TaxID=3376685 RepID=UPI0040438C43
MQLLNGMSCFALQWGRDNGWRFYAMLAEMNNQSAAAGGQNRPSLISQLTAASCKLTEAQDKLAFQRQSTKIPGSELKATPRRQERAAHIRAGAGFLEMTVSKKPTELVL